MKREAIPSLNSSRLLVFVYGVSDFGRKIAMIKKCMKRALVLGACLASLLLLACNGVDDAESVARAYWDAVKVGDQAGAEQLTVEHSVETRGVGFGKAQFESDKVEDIRFGKTVRDGDGARIITTVIPTDNAIKENPELSEIHFDTQLIQVDGEWKVDQQATQQNMIGAVFTMAMSAMGQVFSESMQEAMEDVGEALVDGMTQGMQSVAEDLTESLGDLSEDLRQIVENEGVVEPTARRYQSPVVLPAQVSGSIRGTGVELTSAEWSNTLSIYAGDSWGSNASLLLFLFLDEGKSPAGRIISVKADAGGYDHPHVHYRWHDPETGNIKTEIAMADYDMELKFSEAIEGRVQGDITFSIPGEETFLKGSFTIELQN